MTKKSARRRPRQGTLDGLFSRLVRERDDYTCQICQVNFRDNKGYLDCSHHVGRSKGNTRWYPDNASSKCRECHGKMDRNPLEHIEWVRERLGDDRYNGLRSMARAIFKMTDKDRKDLAQAMREDIKKLESRRAMGEVGPLEL